MQARDLTENPWAEIELPGGGMARFSKEPVDALAPGIYDAGGQRRFTPGLGQDAGAAGAAARTFDVTHKIDHGDGRVTTIKGQVGPDHELVSGGPLALPAPAPALEAPAGIPPSPFEAAPRLTLSGASMSAGPAQTGGFALPGPRSQPLAEGQAPGQPTMDAFQRTRLARMGTGSLLNTRPATGSPTDRIMRAGFAQADAQAEQRAERTRREAATAAEFNLGATGAPMQPGMGRNYLAGREDADRQARIEEAKANRALHETAQREISAGRMTARGLQAGLAGGPLPENATEGFVKGYTAGEEMRSRRESAQQKASKSEADAALFAEDKKISDKLYQAYKAQIDAGQPVTTTINGTQFYLTRMAHEKGLLWRWTPAQPMGLGQQLGQMVSGSAAAATPGQGGSADAPPVPGAVKSPSKGWVVLRSGGVRTNPDDWIPTQ